jgi:hypothetical protein
MQGQRGKLNIVIALYSDHLIDATLAENDDDDDSPLTLPFAPPRSRFTSPSLKPAVKIDSADSDSDSQQTSSLPGTPKTRPRKLKGRDVTKSDHGQVVALLKIFPMGMNPASEYAREMGLADDQFGRLNLSDNSNGGSGNPSGQDGGPSVIAGMKMRGSNSHQIMRDAEQVLDDADVVADKYYASHHVPGGTPVKVKKMDSTAL